MKTSNLLFQFLLVLSLSSCSSENTETIDQPEVPTSISKNAEKFLNEILAILQNNAINRDRIDWGDFEEQVFEEAGNAQTIRQTDSALQLALRLLDDNHSFIRKSDERILSGSSLSCQAPSFSPVSTPDNVGYIKIGFFTGTDFNASLDFATDIQDQIRNQDSADITGWIVDLRGNKGGNMWPMLAGIGPVLGEGIAGYFIGPDNSGQSWSYMNGASLLNQFIQVQIPEPYELLDPDTKVAVLLDQEVISSGEAIAVSFVGRENTKSFGTATCGLSTSNSGFPLSDGSTLFLTTAYMADRNQIIYGVPIEPDVGAGNDDILELALDFIINQ